MSVQNFINIEKLTSENYDTWKIVMQSLLIKNDLWDYGDGTQQKPESDREKLEKWITNDRKAKADLLLSISPQFLKDVKDCDSAKSVWDTLKSTFDSRVPTRKAALLKELILNKASSDNIVEHISEFFSIVEKCKSIDIIIDNDLLSILLLYSLPEEYETFRIAVETRDSLPSPAVLKTKILEEHNARYAQPSTSQVLFAGRKDIKFKSFEKKFHKNNNEKKQNKSRIMCYKCRRYGHKAAECRTKNIEKSSVVQESTFIASNSPSSTWILDSGASSHMVNDKSQLLDLHEIKGAELSLANDETIKVYGKGKLTITTDMGNKINLTNVLYVPNLRANLLSVNKITDHNYNVTFCRNEAVVKNNNHEIILRAKKRNGLYQVSIKNDKNEEAYVANEIQNFMLWHQRYGHLNMKSLKDMIKQKLVKGINIHRVPNCDVTCEICIQAKQTQKPFPKKSTNKAKNPLDLIHCDCAKVTSAGGAKYFITFIDDATRWCEVYFMKQKSEALNMFKIYKAKVENLKDRRIKILRTDNGKEFVNSDFLEFLNEKGIQHQLTADYTPQQNGVAERKNRTLVEMARCMLLQSKLNTTLWAEAISTANYIRNRSPSNSLNGSTPYHLWVNREPNVAHMRTFGTIAYALNKNPMKKKFEPRSKSYYMIGYCENTKAYRLWDKDTKKITKSRDVIFVYENPEINEKNSNVVDITNQNLTVDKLLLEEEEEIKMNEPKNKEIENDKHNKEENRTNLKKEIEPNKNTGEENVAQSKEKGISTQSDTNGIHNRKRGRPQIIRTGARGRPKKLYAAERNLEDRNRKLNQDEDVNKDESQEEILDSPEYKSANEDDDEELFYGFLACEGDPETVSDLQNNPDREKWEVAIKEELQAHYKNKTWTIVDKPQEGKICGCRWVFVTKRDEHGNLIKRKARLVAKGCSQRPGIDYQETYSPVARLTSIRLYYSTICQSRLKASSI